MLSQSPSVAGSVSLGPALDPCRDEAKVRVGKSPDRQLIILEMGRRSGLLIKVLEAGMENCRGMSSSVVRKAEGQGKC
jgi:hypothetical protein